MPADITASAVESSCSKGNLLVEGIPQSRGKLVICSRDDLVTGQPYICECSQSQGLSQDKSQHCAKIYIQIRLKAQEIKPNNWQPILTKLLGILALATTSPPLSSCCSPAGSWSPWRGWWSCTASPNRSAPLAATSSCTS